MYLTRFEQWHDENGKPFNSETIRIDFYESDQQAIEEFEKAIHQDMWIAPNYPTGVQVSDFNRNESRVTWSSALNNRTVCVTLYQLSDTHPIRGY